MCCVCACFSVCLHACMILSLRVCACVSVCVRVIGMCLCVCVHVCDECVFVFLCACVSLCIRLKSFPDSILYYRPHPEILS